MSNRIDRRSFLKGTLMALAGSVVPGIASGRVWDKFVDIRLDRSYEIPSSDGEVSVHRGVDLVYEWCTLMDGFGGKCPELGTDSVIRARGMFEDVRLMRHPEDDFVDTREWMEEMYRRHRNDDFRENYVRYYTMQNEFMKRMGFGTRDVSAMADADFERLAYARIARI